ncbi:MAG: hypothetical protein IJ731_08820 [Eubacterium sp.]|nr:hypothetical protein [Eubacterium sp.]
MEKESINQYSKNFTLGNNNIVISINAINRIDKISVSFKDIISFNREYVLSSLVAPWLASESMPFSDIYNNNLYIDPDLKANGDKYNISLKEYFDIFVTDNHKTWVLGDAGCGKTTLLKHTFLEYVDSGKKAIYFTADNFKINVKSSNEVFSVNDIHFDDNLTLFIDGIDEVFATDLTQLGNFINCLKHFDCEMWLGCRTSFFNKYSKILMELCGSRIIVQDWLKDDVTNYITEYCKNANKPQLLNKINSLICGNDSIMELCTNPLRLSMLIFIVDNTPNNMILDIKNDFNLYSRFFELWISNESRRLNTKYDETDLYEVWYRVSRELYETNKSTITLYDNIEIISSLLRITTYSNGNLKTDGFYHRSLMEYLLAKQAIESMGISPEKTIHTLKYNNRSDVDHYIKRGFETLPYKKINHIINTIIPAYYLAPEKLQDNDEIFCVQNQIVYYITRMKTTNNEPIVTFLKDIYSKEERPIMRQGIAYGAANLGLFDIALQFAKEMEPGSEADIVNRSWTLVFYGDVSDINVDPIRYRDDGIVPWDNSRNARLRRFKSNSKKDKAFRMFDLCVMIGFYISRNWTDLCEDDLKIIKKCETNISEFGNDVIEFLNEKKKYLVDEYIKHMNN